MTPSATPTRPDRPASVPARLLTGLVRLYQWTLRPMLGPNCRFEPSCSDYAVESLRRHGAGRGSLLAAWRILRCNPLAAGGYDPVPPTPGSRIPANAASPTSCTCHDSTPAASLSRPRLAGPSLHLPSLHLPSLHLPSLHLPTLRLRRPARSDDPTRHARSRSPA